ncbi:MAG: transglycosylase domain-containing protein [Bacilli bacterium]|nr:transglycosylase domain-containing protein [Bacilli bacterium]
MAQKKVKRRSQVKTSKKSSNATRPVNSVGRRTTKIKKKSSNTGKIALGLAIVALLLACYMALGFIATALFAVIIGILICVWVLIYRIPGNRKTKKILNILLILFLICGIIGLTAFSLFIAYIKVNADPKFEKGKLNTAEITRIYDKDGAEIAKLGSEKREKVTYDELPEVLVDAIIATEDSRFFQHNGLDAPRFFKATVGQLTGNSNAGGASTLSMQVVKNSFTDKYGQKTSGVTGIIRKFEDVYLAVFRLEKEYTKEQIIEYYVNNHFLGGNIYGVEEAANAYFGKSVGELNLSEAAIIAGMFKSPNFYRPTANPKNATARRQTVLYLMKRAGYITAEEEKVANAIPVESLTAEVNTSVENKYQGYIDTVVEEVQDKYGVNPYTTPLLVYTNLDKARQNAVNAVLAGETYSWIDDRVQTGVAVIESETGKVLAIGNGRNINSRNNSTASQFNYATQIKRQPGSTAKPLFDYGPGIEYNNWSTGHPFNDAPYTYSNGVSIKNWDGGYFGNITLRRALSASRNIPALKAFQQVKNEKIKEFVTGLGIIPELCPSGYIYNKDKDNCYNKDNTSDVKDTIALHEAHSIGAFTGVSPIQMAGAYAAFSNGGYYNEPYSVNKIVFRQTGKTVEHKENKRQVMSDATAFMISSVLQDVSLTGGTPRNVACKTGTTNFDENTMNRYNMPSDAIRDSWVIGYSTKTTIGMWYGYDDFTKESIAQGYVLHNIPATIQKDRLFNALVASGAMEGNREEFKQPASVVRISIAPGTNPPKLAAPGGPAISEFFKKGTEPTEYDTASYRIPAPGNLNVSEAGGGKVTLSWSPVSPLDTGDDHGKFGYNIYKDDVLITWTDKTSYTFAPSSPYGTYKVIGTYKSYNDIQSAAAIFTLNEPIIVIDEDPDPEPETPDPPTQPDSGGNVQTP